MHETNWKRDGRMAHMNDATVSNIPTNIAAAPAPFANPASSTPAIAAVAPTPGWKTTEFWMTAIGQAGLVLAAASGALPTKYAVLAGALSQVAYSVSRGLAKSGAATA